MKLCDSIEFDNKYTLVIANTFKNNGRVNIFLSINGSVPVLYTRIKKGDLSEMLTHNVAEAKGLREACIKAANLSDGETDKCSIYFANEVTYNQLTGKLNTSNKILKKDYGIIERRYFKVFKNYLEIRYTNKDVIIDYLEKHNKPSDTFISLTDFCKQLNIKPKHINDRLLENGYLTDDLRPSDKAILEDSFESRSGFYGKSLYWSIPLLSRMLANS